MLFNVIFTILKIENVLEFLDEILQNQSQCRVPHVTGTTINLVVELFTLQYAILNLKANVSQEILNWHSLRHCHSADICIHFY